MKRQPYKMETHVFSRIIAGKRCCKWCGLVALRNSLTDWCIKKGCNNEDHPQFKSIVRRLG